MVAMFGQGFDSPRLHKKTCKLFAGFFIQYADEVPLPTNRFKIIRREEKGYYSFNYHYY